MKEYCLLRWGFPSLFVFLELFVSIFKKKMFLKRWFRCVWPRCITNITVEECLFWSFQIGIWLLVYVCSTTTGGDFGHKSVNYTFAVTGVWKSQMTPSLCLFLLFTQTSNRSDEHPISVSRTVLRAADAPAQSPTSGEAKKQMCPRGASVELNELLAVPPRNHLPFISQKCFTFSQLHSGIWQCSNYISVLKWHLRN